MKLLYLFAIYCVSLLILQNDVQATISIIDSYGKTVEQFPNRFATATYLYKKIDGYMEASIPPDACTEIYPPTFPQNYTLNKIVLINGTEECGFLTKVQNARSAGYDTAMLFDPYPGFFDYPNLSFPLDVSKVNINVVLISYDNAISVNNFLYHNISGKENFTIEIFRDMTPLENFYMYCIVVVLVSILGIVYQTLKCCVKEILRNWNAASNNETPPVFPDRLDAIRNEFRDLLSMFEQTAQRPSTANITTALRNLQRTFPSTKFSQEDDSFQKCVICYNDFQIGEMIRVLGCCHVYHASCIDDWFEEKNLLLTCPLCQQSFSLEVSSEHSSLVLTDSESAPLLNPTNDLPSTSGYEADNSYSPSNSEFCTPVGSVNEYDGFLAGDKGSVNSA
ncbi:hypothetical protein JTE90_005857 [Oedothorax gibbosus]|uniref:RING-type domain-containing protein n=1 Tax=Oedothorax gibbosus TaxID=931172 RepID=A0AAV6UQ30_9ARAC|nr:hypothetical protein JTE90_005857 [Oedothorax gibbosus]